MQFLLIVIKFKQQNHIPNILFYGPPGTGKTSTIKALARQMYGNKRMRMVLELNASDDRGINTVREVIKDFVSTKGLNFEKKNEKNNQISFKLVILDQADSMTNPTQFALRRSKYWQLVIEQFYLNSRFCIICNNSSKIIPALQSRCTKFKFGYIPIQESKARVLQICQLERLNIENNGLDVIFKQCQGDMRRIINMLQSLYLAVGQNSPPINDSYVYQFTGSIRPQQINMIYQKLLATTNFQKVYKDLLMYLKERGISLGALITEIFHLLKTNRVIAEQKKAFLMKRFAELQYRQSIGCNEQLQLSSLVGTFVQIQ